MSTEKNILIAEFMGFQKTNIGWYDFEESLNLPNTIDNTFDNLLFDKSWDWLMPVVDRIEGLKIVVDIHRHWGTMVEDEVEEMYFCTMQIKEGHTIDIAWEDNKIDAVYKAVVEFIKWYNNK